MPIDPAIEAPTRDILGAMLRDDVDTVEERVTALDKVGRFNDSLALVTRIAGAAALDMTNGERPADQWFTDVSRQLAELDDGANSLTASEADSFLRRIVFDGERLDAVLPVEDAIRVPYVVTATLLASSGPEGRQWWEWLDFLESALETAHGPTG